MKGKPIDQLVHEHMFPKPKSTEPQNFHAFLQRYLLTEVRQETAAFYGSVDSREAQYPGLDYSYAPHRMRLSRFTWHRRLFRAFDALGLTKSEIAGLTKWEGTKWAKERFEKEQGFKIRDTTGDGIHDWVAPKDRKPAAPAMEAPDQICENEEMEDAEEDADDTEGMDEDEDESDVEIQSIGIELNERLRAAAAQRAAGNPDAVMDEAWEQWLKDIAEGGVPDDIFSPLQTSIAGQTLPSSTIPPRLLNAGRLGQWHQIPEFLHNLVRENIAVSNPQNENSQPPRAASIVTQGHSTVRGVDRGSQSRSTASSNGAATTA